MDDTDDPFRIFYEDADLYADLGIEKADSETGARRALVIEIKGFLENSVLHGLEIALGQYIAYRSLLKIVAPEHRLYLAVAATVYHSQFQRKSFQLIVQDNQVALLIVDVPQEEVVAWIN